MTNGDKLLTITVTITKIISTNENITGSIAAGPKLQRISEYFSF